MAARMQAVLVVAAHQVARPRAVAAQRVVVVQGEHPLVDRLWHLNLAPMAVLVRAHLAFCQGDRVVPACAKSFPVMIPVCWGAWTRPLIAHASGASAMPAAQNGRLWKAAMDAVLPQSPCQYHKGYLSCAPLRAPIPCLSARLEPLVVRWAYHVCQAAKARAFQSNKLALALGSLGCQALQFWFSGLDGFFKCRSGLRQCAPQFWCCSVISST
jgi:hypothetical protein